jgi:hypothetical protein
MFPDAKHAPPCPAQCSCHESVAILVCGKFATPKCSIIFRLGFVFGTTVPETTVHEQCEPCLPENKVRPHAKGGRAVLPFRPDYWAAQQRGPAANLNLPPPAGDFVPAQQFCQRDFRLFVPARADARHDFGTLFSGKHISHLIFRHVCDFGFCENRCGGKHHPGRELLYKTQNF